MRKFTAILIVMFSVLGAVVTPLAPAIAAPSAPPSPPPTPPLLGISGTVADAVTGAYFSAPNVWVGLYQIAWGRSWVAGTDCSVGQGCASPTGDFNFSGPFAPGRYEVEVWVSNGRYLVLRYPFQFDGASANTGVLLVEPKPVLVEIVAVSPAEVPSGGGILDLEYEICQNPAGRGGPIQYRARASLIATPAGGWYADQQVGNHRGIVGNRVPANKFRDNALVSASPPDGTWVCVRILVTDAKDSFQFYDEMAACVPKGFITGPSWFEPRCSSPTPPPVPVPARTR